MTPEAAFASGVPDLNLEWGPVLIQEGKPEILTAIRHEEILELGRLARGKKVLEIGSAHGYSAISMVLAGANQVVTIDDHNGWTQLGDTLGILTKNLETFGVRDRVIIYTGDSATCMLDMIKDQMSFDFAFIDGSPEFSQLVLDIRLSMALVRQGGSITIHDYGHPDYSDKKKVVDLIFPQGPDKLVTSLFIKNL